MAKGPEDAPLGATPMLPPPTGAAADRAEGAFKDYLDRLRTDGPTLEPPEPPPPSPSPPEGALEPDSFGGGRRYDLALSKVGAGTEPPEGAFTPEVSEQPVDSGPVETFVEVTESQDADELPPRPPPNTPFVRAPITRGTGAETVPQDLLESAADSAMLSTDADGTTSFDIAFSDELFQDVACRISVADGKIVATFRVHDDNTRRLLEAEAGRLRVRLEERGLRVAEVRVEIER